MDEDDREEIAQLERRIEGIAESIERCRKLDLTAKLAIGAGAAWLVLLLIGVIAFAPINIVAAIAALLGGTVLLGSNSSTWKQAAAALSRAEAQRTERIERIALRTVPKS